MTAARIATAAARTGGKKIRGGIDGSASKGDNEDDTDSWDKHDCDVEGEEGPEW